ncbi:vacuolar protein sorting-associated protein 52 homolog [Styela clava]|uniref:vacuolar protein sorting-associated protein 52 homolog n=1 Tax=Styela clava TaxID=7725 RepID=UPI00193ADCA8|nr:vacuolar protein sorting-associated protein 52 homolog [Styela clava]
MEDSKVFTGLVENQPLDLDQREADLDMYYPDLEDLQLLASEDMLETVGEHIQENLEDDLVKEALEKGVDLREYAKNIEKDLTKVEKDSIQDYIRESKRVADLHKRIGSCESVLERMEGMLHGFQHALSSISSEIQSLQEQSITMNMKLKNRQSVKSELSQLVDEMVVPEAMITAILEIPVTEREFLEQLHELNHKIKFLKQHSFNDTLACRDVSDTVQKLKFKAVAKIREYLLQKVYSFRKPMSNYEVPQNAMLKSRFYYEFLLSNERAIAKEVQEEYVDTMSKVYFSYFKTYVSRLMKVQYDEVADKDDLIAIEDTARRGFFSSKMPLKNRATIFTLGGRGSILTTDLESAVIVPHAAQRIDKRYPFESLFRSEHYAFMDNCCREYLFLCDFFLVTKASAQEMFNSVMGKTISMLMKHVASYTNDSFDSIALFLCIHIVDRYRKIMQKRDIFALNRYWDTVQDILWPRFEHIVKLNTQSIKTCDVNSLASIDVRPHYITRRYAEFSAAIVGINETSPNTLVDQVLEEMQSEVQNFILRMASCFNDRKDQLIFLINNYDMMLSVIIERTTDESKESDSFQHLLNSSTQEYIEEVLSSHFLTLITFIKQVEPLSDSSQMDLLKKAEHRVMPLVRSFTKNWKTSIQSINQEVMNSFTNFKNGTSILQAALTQLIQYYHRFQKILSHQAFKSLPTRAEMVNIHHVMVEVKKYKPNF